MKYLFTIMALIISHFLYSQSTGYLRYDSIRMEKIGGNSELILLNGTRDSIGFLYNRGNGRTSFRTLNSLGISSNVSNGITKSGDTAQQGGAFIKETQLPQAGYKLQYSGSGEFIVGDSGTGSQARFQVKNPNPRGIHFSTGPEVNSDAYNITSGFDSTQGTGSQSSSNIRTYGVLNSRQIYVQHTPTSYSAKWGFYNQLGITARGGDSLRLLSQNADLFNAGVSELAFKNNASSPGKKKVQTSSFNFDAPSAQLNQIVFSGSSGSSYYYLPRPSYIASTTSYIIGSTVDTIDGTYIGFLNSGKGGSNVYIKKSMGFVTGPVTTAYDTLIGVYSIDSSSRSANAGDQLIGQRLDQPSQSQYADSSAQFQVVSRRRGSLPAPAMATAQMTAIIGTKLNGLMVYNTDSLAYCFWNGSVWAKIGSGGGGGSSDHATLSNLAWTSSGHTGTASRLAGFNGSGSASYYALGTDVQAQLSGTGLVSFSGTTPSYNTTSASIAGIISDETGSGALVFGTSPTFTTPLLGTPTSGTLTNTTGYLWNNLANPTGTQTLSWDDAELNSWTNGSNTETFLTVDNPSQTTGTSLKLNSSSLTTGKMVDIQVSGTAGATNQTGLNIDLTGNNASASQTTFAATFNNAHGGTTPVNGGLAVSASGGAVGSNPALLILGNKSTSTTAGLEIEYDNSGNTTRFKSWDRSGATYKDIKFEFANFDMVASASTRTLYITSTGRVALRNSTTATAYLHLGAGTTAASTAPLKFTSGTSMTSPEAGAVEYTTDDLFFTIATGTARKRFLFADGAGGLTANRVAVATTNGRIFDNAALTFSGGALTVGEAGVTSGKYNISGATSGTITIQTQVASGTYNFNLPATAGSSGQALISGGGGSNPITYLDLAGSSSSPTITGVANVASSSSPVIQYTRAGNRISLSGYVNITPTAGTTKTTFRVSLPVASNFLSATEAPGTASATDGTTFAPGSVIADAINDELQVSFTSLNTSSHNVTFSVTYVIQ